MDNKLVELNITYKNTQSMTSWVGLHGVDNFSHLHVGFRFIPVKDKMFMSP